MIHTAMTVQQHEENRVWRGWGKSFGKRRSLVNLTCDFTTSTKQRKGEVGKWQWLGGHERSKK